MGTKAPTVSVIIATYNSAKTLKAAIQSVLLQEHSDFEVWIVGDGCTDNSPGVVASFADDRLHWVNLSQNSGSASIPNNEGVRRAKGTYMPPRLGRRLQLLLRIVLRFVLRQLRLLPAILQLLKLLLCSASLLHQLLLPADLQLLLPACLQLLLGVLLIDRDRAATADSEVKPSHGHSPRTKSTLTPGMTKS